MPDLIVLVPSRGRPDAARACAESFAAASTAGSALIFVVDKDDPEVDRYNTNEVRAGGAGLHITPTHTMVEALNYAALSQAKRDDSHAPFAIGFCGDDHRFRSAGWDQAYLDALREMGTGIVYGNDLLQGEALPTQMAMTSDIIRELGFMAPPDLVHMYADNWWRELGRTAGCLRYLPDVIVEHMHPVAGKADWDEGHKRVNAPEMYDRDATTFARLQMRELPGAAVRVRRLRSARAGL